jgi:sialic acid synthase SpsE
MSAREFDLGPRKIGDGHPCIIVFEAGATHTGLESAIALTKLAAAAGADAIKFQILDPDRLVADRKMPFSYEVLADRASGKTETVTEPIYDILCRRSLTAQQWKQVCDVAKSCNIAFFATVTFPEDVDLIADVGGHSIKIASADVNHFPLIRYAARAGLCIQLDTGNATLGEVEEAVDVIRGEGNDRIVIHQCPTGYPARLDSINLNIIRSLRQIFPFPVAFSDHTPGWEMDVAAVAIGANLVEKTITADRMTRSTEHIFSLEPPQMKNFIRTVRDVEKALGQPRRILQLEERERRRALRRSVFLPEGGRKGAPLSGLKVEFRRPGFGIGPDDFERLGDRVLAHDVPAGHMLAPLDID